MEFCEERYYSIPIPTSGTVSLEYSQLGREKTTGMCVRQGSWRYTQQVQRHTQSCCPKMLLAYGRSSRCKHNNEGASVVPPLLLSHSNKTHTHAQKACHHTSISGPRQPLLAQTKVSEHASAFCAHVYVCMPVSCVSEAVRTL